VIRHSFHLLIFVFICSSSRGQISQPVSTAPTNAEFDALVKGCLKTAKKDPICDYVVTLQQVGLDSIEFVKEYANFGPYQYAFFTLANYAATRRVRIRTHSFLDEKGHHIYDLKNDYFVFWYERRF
jgi:hypothetical protein